MFAYDLIGRFHRHEVILYQRDGRLVLESDRPFIPGHLADLCRKYRQELLRFLDFEEKADALLLESSRRLAPTWKAELEAWDGFEEEIRAAYREQDLERLAWILEAREAYATAAAS